MVHHVHHVHHSNHHSSMKVNHKTTCGNVSPGFHGSISHGNIHVDYGGAKFSGKINVGHNNAGGNVYVCPTAPTNYAHPTAPIITGGFHIPF